VLAAAAEEVPATREVRLNLSRMPKLTSLPNLRFTSTKKMV
jgi:hypothetical protein